MYKEPKPPQNSGFRPGNHRIPADLSAIALVRKRVAGQQRFRKSICTQAVNESWLSTLPSGVNSFPLGPMDAIRESPGAMPTAWRGHARRTTPGVGPPGTVMAPHAHAKPWAWHPAMYNRQRQGRRIPPDRVGPTGRRTPFVPKGSNPRKKHDALSGHQRLIRAAWVTPLIHQYGETMTTIRERMAPDGLPDQSVDVLEKTACPVIRERYVPIRPTQFKHGRLLKSFGNRKAL